jgi:hypothetical protein
LAPDPFEQKDRDDRVDEIGFHLDVVLADVGQDKSALPILRQLGKQVGTDQLVQAGSKMDVKSLASMAKVGARSLRAKGSR